MTIRKTVAKQNNMILHFFFLIELSICYPYVFLNLSIYRLIYIITFLSLHQYELPKLYISYFLFLLLSFCTIRRFWKKNIISYYWSL